VQYCTVQCHDQHQTVYSMSSTRILSSSAGVSRISSGKMQRREYSTRNRNELVWTTLLHWTVLYHDGTHGISDGVHFPLSLNSSQRPVRSAAVLERTVLYGTVQECTVPYKLKSRHILYSTGCHSWKPMEGRMFTQVTCKSSYIWCGSTQIT
jgi:hypothetical protein